ncbi:hypothetical protein [Nocardiopsis sp. CNR-923]|uniref:hypothetical protein n=1 Tax=Nocardiopsis sp. CNR-923 TaxID=1904965 RepID=UPI0021CCCE55
MKRSNAVRFAAAAAAGALALTACDNATDTAEDGSGGEANSDVRVVSPTTSAVAETVRSTTRPTAV